MHMDVYADSLYMNVGYRNMFMYMCRQKTSPLSCCFRDFTSACSSITSGSGGKERREEGEEEEEGDEEGEGEGEEGKGEKEREEEGDGDTAQIYA